MSVRIGIHVMTLKSFSLRTHSRGPSSSRRPSIHSGSSTPRGREHRGREVDRADRIVHHVTHGHVRAAHQQRNPKQRVVAERALEDHLVLAEELAVVGGDDHERVVGEARASSTSSTRPIAWSSCATIP